MQLKEVILVVKEQERSIVVIKKLSSYRLKLNYALVASWISLKVHSALQAVGLTAAFSNPYGKKELAVMWLRYFIMTMYFLMMMTP